MKIWRIYSYPRTATVLGITLYAIALSKVVGL